MSNSIKDSAQAFAVNQVLKYVDSNPQEAFPKLLDWADKFDKDNLYLTQRQQIRKVMEQPDSNWMRLINSLWTDIDSEVRKVFFRNFIVNASLLGSRKQVANREKYGCNIPWAILMDPTSACNLHCTGCWAAEYGSLDDIQLALVPVSKKSASVYKSVVILYKSIFRAAKESRIIDDNPTIYLTTKGGGVPQKDKAALTDDQAARLLDTVQGLPPYVFVMLGLYAGLRREEILALKWDAVYLDGDFPYLAVRRAWHTENNRPVILDELKTKAAERNIPLPTCLAECLKEAKANSTSEYVVANRDGDPLSYTQFKRLWQYIVTRTAKPRMARKLVDGKYVKYMLYPELGEKARNNGHVVYSLDFEVTPHQLRHTYITNLIHSSVDPKTVQYLAGHESSKITMDIYAKVKYNRPDELVRTMGNAFAQWDAVRA